MYSIKQITAEETLSVRHPVLRDGKPIKSSRFEGDDLLTTRHFGMYAGDRLIGVISAFEKTNALFNDAHQIQLRGMAILEEFRNKGAGKQLLGYCENELKSDAHGLIWFNARSAAVGFYEKMGYGIIGSAFEIKDIGTHFVMSKNV
jgi:GNAT superfamily N-acetyltransferase